MNTPIDRLCDQLRIKLHGIDRRLEALKANGSDISDKSRHQIESQMDSVQQRIFDRRRAVEAANARVTAWIERKKPAFDGNLAEWREHRNLLGLNSRADDAEAYALAVFDLAIAAADEAAQAALEALLARRDATGAALPIGPGMRGRTADATHPPTKVGRSGQGLAALAFAAMLTLMASMVAEAKPPSAPAGAAERRAYTTEESKKLGDEAQRVAETQQRIWDRKMKDVSGSICRGC